MPSLTESGASTAAQFFTLPFRRRRQQYTISQPDEVYNVIYLGNVLTVMAKGYSRYLYWLLGFLLSREIINGFTRKRNNWLLLFFSRPVKFFHQIGQSLFPSFFTDFLKNIYGKQN